jgi:hypothetical protein
MYNITNISMKKENKSITVSLELKRDDVIINSLNFIVNQTNDAEELFNSVVEYVKQVAKDDYIKRNAIDKAIEELNKWQWDPEKIKSVD